MKPVIRPDHKHACFYNSSLTYNNIEKISRAFKPKVQKLLLSFLPVLLKLYTFVTTY